MTKFSRNSKATKRILHENQATNPIPYENLDTSRQEIRLITIKPGALNQGIIRCTLSTVSLNDKPTYEALSYAWGDASKRAKVFVDGVLVSITISLERALRRLRQVDADRIIWADAICINQEDLAERSDQVSLMGEIYSSCVRVMIWLGEKHELPMTWEVWERPLLGNIYYQDHIRFRDFIESNGLESLEPIKPSKPFETGDSSLDVPAAEAVIRMMAENKHFHEMPFYRITNFPDYEVCNIWKNAWRSLANVLERPWWWRVWTLQEAALPPNGIILLGEHQMDLDLFLDAAKNFSEHSTLAPCCYSVYGSPYENFTMDRTMHIVAANLQRLNDAKGLSEQKARQFYRVFNIAEAKRASDPKDYIYGFCGLFPGLLGPDEKPNYELDTGTVFTKATIKWIETRGDLECLKLTSKQEKLPNLPSWVPCWGEESKTLNDMNWWHRACGQFATYELPNVHSDIFLLPIHAHRVDIIRAIGHELLGWRMAFHGANSRPTFIRRINEWKHLVPGKSEKQFWRTLFRDTPPWKARRSTTGIQEDDFQTISTWWDWMNNLQTNDIFNIVEEPKARDKYEDKYEYKYEEIVFALRMIYGGLGTDSNHLFMATDQGRIGVARQGMVPGDGIYIVKGCQTPLILRPLSSAAVEEFGWEYSESFQFIGACYVDGCMMGEAVQDEVSWERLYLR